MAAILTAAVVGCGRVGSGYDQRATETPFSHAGAYTAHEGIRLVAGIDPDEGARDRFAARWGVPAFSDLGALTELAPDLISIATPPDGREDVVVGALAAGPRALWIEKPLASSYGAGERIVAACAGAGVSLQVNFQRRFDPLHRDLAAAVQDAEGPVHIHVCYSKGLELFGVHGLDLVRWLGGEVQLVDTLPVPGREPIVMLRCADGATGVMINTPAPSGTDIFDLDVRTATARFAVSAAGEQCVRATVEPSPHFAPVAVHRFEPDVRRDGLARAMFGAVNSLVGFVTDGERPFCTGEDGLAALRLYEAVQRSAATSVSVELAVQ